MPAKGGKPKPKPPPTPSTKAGTTSVRSKARGAVKKRGRPSGLNDRQKRFVHEYLVDLDPGAAYIRAGYNAAEGESASVCACRLLRSVWVMEYKEQLQREAMAATDINRNDTILRFKYVYLAAMAVDDFGNALRALENIGRYLGLFEKDNEQKKYTENDIERLRTELEAVGFNFEIAAYKDRPAPPELAAIMPRRVEVVPVPTNGVPHAPTIPPPTTSPDLPNGN